MIRVRSEQLCGKETVTALPPYSGLLHNNANSRLLSKITKAKKTIRLQVASRSRGVRELRLFTSGVLPAGSDEVADAAGNYRLLICLFSFLTLSCRLSFHQSSKAQS